MSVTFAMEDGHSLEINNAILNGQTNPGWTPARYEAVSGLELHKRALDGKRATADIEKIAETKISSVEYFKAKSHECVSLLTLSDGRRVLITSAAKADWPREVAFNSLEVYEPVRDYQIVGMLEGKEFTTKGNVGSLLTCLRFWDLPNKTTLEVRKVTFTSQFYVAPSTDN